MGMRVSLIYGTVDVPDVSDFGPLESPQGEKKVVFPTLESLGHSESFTKVRQTARTETPVREDWSNYLF